MSFGWCIVSKKKRKGVNCAKKRPASRAIEVRENQGEKVF